MLKNNKKKTKTKMLTRLVILIILLILIFILLKRFRKDNLAGTWNIDSVTSYEFDGNRGGILKLPSSEYKFTYEINNNILKIDFIDDSATDAIYKYTVNGNILELDGIDNTLGNYRLTKK